jgi:hypothetical protein
VCGASGASDTSTCNAAIVKALNDARKTLGLADMRSFSITAFDKLNNDQQIFTMADIERTSRGLPPLAGLTAQLNGVALIGAKDRRDPSTSLPLRLTGGAKAYYYGSNFAEGTANGMGADYYFMYDDGLGSANADCTPSNESGCWGHRYNILGPYGSADRCPRGAAIHMVMGAAEVISGVRSAPATTEIFTNDCGALPTMDFTWTQAEALVFPA